MTYEECMNLVSAYAESVVLVSALDKLQQTASVDSLSSNAAGVRDCLGDFITSLLYESPIGDGRRDDAR